MILCPCENVACHMTADDPRHGSHAAYTNQYCRCNECRRANTDYQARYRNRDAVQSDTVTVDVIGERSQYRRGKAVVSVGKPFYGNRKIIANAPLNAASFDDLIACLTEAKAGYQDR